jgi:crossover junction endodeoxyribonuclease RuvC
MIILGIDPGLSTTGFGAIRCDRRVPSVMQYGHIKTSPREHISTRLFHIHNDMESLIRSIRPDLIAVENAFSLLRYPRAGILLGSVLGIIYLSVCQNGIRMAEITPKEIKNALAGYGSAGKHQIKSTVKKQLGVEDIKSSHASDALAVALTAFYRKIVKGK